MSDITAEEEPKKKINLVVKNTGGHTVNFLVKPGTLFSKLFTSYCSKMRVAEDSSRFLFDGQRLRKDQCPEDHEMEDGDVIDVMVEQTGGAREVLRFD